MANLIPFEELKRGNVYYEDFRCGETCIPCLVTEEIDDTHLKMRYGVECPWNQVTKVSPNFRYWDEPPTKEEREETTW